MTVPLTHNVFQNGQISCKNVEAFAARLLQSPGPFWENNLITNEHLTISNSSKEPISRLSCS